MLSCRFGIDGAENAIYVVNIYKSKGDYTGRGMRVRSARWVERPHEKVSRLTWAYLTRCQW